MIMTIDFYDGESGGGRLVIKRLKIIGFTNRGTLL